MQAQSFKSLKPFNGELAITRPASAHDGAREDDSTFRGSQDKLIERASHLVRNGHFCSKLLRLIISACHQRNSRNAGWKAQIILDLSGSSRLATKGATIEHQNRQ